MTHKWYPSKKHSPDCFLYIPESSLWVCQEHFEFLAKVHDYEIIEESSDFISVRSVPIPEDEDEPPKGA